MYEWTNGEVITADKLNNTGNVVNLSFENESAPPTRSAAPMPVANVSFNDLKEYISKGIVPMFAAVFQDGDEMEIKYFEGAYIEDGKYTASFNEIKLVADTPTEKMRLS